MGASTGPTVDFVNVPLLAASALVFLSVLSGVWSTRVGFPFLLVFLVAGLLAGEGGPGGLQFDDFGLSFWVGNVALAVILLDGGLRTSVASFRAGLRPSLLLASAGVLVTSVLTGLAATLLLGVDWRVGVLLGSIVGSTDAAAVFALLKKCGVRLNERVATTLEIESGMNDPMAIYLTLLFIAIVMGSGTGGVADALSTFALQFGLGSVFGLGAGFALAALFNRLPPANAGITALLLASAGLVVFSAAGWAGGSGFLAVYLFGVVVGHRAGGRVNTALGAMDGHAWLAQAGMFLLLGLLATPSQLLQVAGPALGVAAALMLVARPAAVWLCLAPFRFPAREVWFISWVGLRGSVPIVLAVFPLMAGVPQAMLLFNVAFVVVLVSLLLQGTTIALAARRFGVALPDEADVQGRRQLFGDFVLDPRAYVGEVCEAYGLERCPGEGLTLDAWIVSALGRTPVVGDQVELGSAVLAIRAMEGAAIAQVGLKFADPADAAAAARREVPAKAPVGAARRTTAYTRGP